MAALCRSYASHAEALPAVSAVLDAGIPGDGVRVLSGQPERDARAERVGEFSGSTAPGAPVGEFAGGTHGQGHEEGHFAGGEQRGGSFADADREEVVSYPGGVEQARYTGHHEIKRLLTDAGLDDAAAEQDVQALHAGRVLVLVTSPDEEAERVAQLLDG
jgi:hypothetical protein